MRLTKPTNGAFEALVKLVRYCASTPKLAIRQDLTKHVECLWQLLSDSDMAGNAEPGNKTRRRSQLGYVAMLGSAPTTYMEQQSVAGAVQSSSLARLRFQRPRAGARDLWRHFGPRTGEMRARWRPSNLKLEFQTRSILMQSALRELRRLKSAACRPRRGLGSSKRGGRMPCEPAYRDRGSTRRTRK